MRRTTLVPGKIRLLYLFAFGFFLVLLLFAVRWQVVDAAKLVEEIDLRQRERLIPSIRGPILSRDGSTLAYSEPRFDLYLYIPEIQYAEVNQLQNREELYEQLSPYVEMQIESEYPPPESDEAESDDDVDKASEEYDPPTVDEYLDGKFDYSRKYGVWWFPIVEGLTLQQKNEVESIRREKDGGRLEGVSLEYAQQRFYPEKELAGSVVGFADILEDGSIIGKAGVEKSWNGNLEPQQGYVKYDIDAAGNPVTSTTGVTIQAQRGSTVQTTIDKFLQSKLEETLREGLEEFDATTAHGVIMDPKNGDILALANYPSFDPNTREVEEQDHLGNAAVTQPYEIGSVGKAFTVAAAIDSDTFGPKDLVIEGHDGCEDLIEGFKVCNLFGRKSGPLTLERATVMSDNVAFYHISKELTPDVLAEYLDKFGVGYPSGVDLQGESYGLIKPPERWNENDISAYSYGTSYQMNVVQAAAAVSSLANNGVRMQPRVVSQVIDADGKIYLQEPQAVERVVSADSAKVINQVLHEVYKSNLGTYYLPDYRQYPIAMKSGTGLIVRDGVYSDDYNGSYVGYDISSQRRFLMYIRLNSPQVGRISGDNARYVWFNAFTKIKDYLGY